MNTTTTTTGKLGSIAEDLFINLFCDVFGSENTQNSIYVDTNKNLLKNLLW